MKSGVYKFKGKMFRYNYDDSVVEYIYKATAEEIKDEQEWIEKHGIPLINIGKDGYVVVMEVGLSEKNWKNKEVRDEYLLEWVYDIDEENNALLNDFIKYELPMMSRK